MKLSKQLAILIALFAIGLFILSLLSLNIIKSNLVESRKHEIQSVLSLATEQINHYVDLEKQGKLSHEEAEAKVIEALTTMRSGSSYIWANGDDGRSKVHPNKEQLGVLQESYAPSLKALQNVEFVFNTGDYPKAGSSGLYPKINGMTKISEWKWVFGYGIYLDDLEEDFLNTAIYFTMIGSGILVFIIIATIIVSRIILKSILKNIGGEPRYVNAVTSRIADGHLNEPIQGKFDDDSLLGYVYKMQQSLKEMAQNIHQGSALLTSSTTSLNDQMQNILAASQQSSEASQSTASAIQELSCSIEVITQTANETERNSEASYETASQGERLVQDSAHSINEISAQIERSTDEINGLQERSLEIGTIVKVIREIAEQTNLLALNAAIEAARAGEYGRGFAVVADEVRTLASRTATATSEITETINLVRADTENVAQTMQAVLPKVRESVEISNQVTKMLTEIRLSSDKNLTNIREMSSSSAEQNKATQSLAMHAEEISRIMQETSGAISTSKKSTDDLSKLAVELQSSASFFKL
jgi:methyl-accepting chemotaxis protein